VKGIRLDTFQIPTEMLMRRFMITVGFLLLLPVITCGQSKSSWLQGVWAGTGYQSNDDSKWTMKLTIRKNKYLVEYPSLECGGTWRLVSVSRSRAVFRETITKRPDVCASRGNVVIERLNTGQVGFWYSYRGTNEFVASAILNKQR
jgi:hypothetical protein